LLLQLNENAVNQKKGNKICNYKNYIYLIKQEKDLVEQKKQLELEEKYVP
jgi:hypothetical protein